MLGLQLSNRKRHWIVSLSQFREEKNHALQLYIIHGLIQRHDEKDLQGRLNRMMELPNKSALDLCLVMMGSTRNEHDAERVAQLCRLADELSMRQHFYIYLCIFTSLFPITTIK